MRINLPHDLPRDHAPKDHPSEAPLYPSSIELRREALAARAADRHPMPHAPQNRRRHPEQARKPDSRSVAPDRPMDRRPRRQTIPPQAIGMSLRDEERQVLAEVGRFRVVATRDLAETIYDGRRSRMEHDLAFLRDKGLVEVDAVNARRDGRGGKVERIEVVTLTQDGRSFARMTSGLPQDQKLYAGMVKPREVEHDAQIYRAYLREAKQIEQKGGTNLRVQLDFELKSQIQKAIYAERKADPERDISEIKQQVAKQFDLPYVNGGIQIPDARIEYDPVGRDGREVDRGSRTGHEDIEVLTAAYRPGHLHNKAQAGFHVYASFSDRATLTAKVEDDHHLMQSILEL